MPVDDVSALARALTELAAVPTGVQSLRAEVAALREDLGALRRALPPVLLSVPEAARVLGVSVTTVRRQVRAGTLPTVRVGSAVRIDLSRMHAIEPRDVVRLAYEARERATAPARRRAPSNRGSQDATSGKVA